MSGENRGLEENILENMQESAAIPRETEERLQDAYDEIRLRCREQRASMGRKTGTDNRTGNSSGRFAGKRRIRFSAALIAAAVLAVSSLCVYAGILFFDKNVVMEEAQVTYSFEVNYDLKPVKVTAVPGYLPEGMKPDGEGKYYPEDNYGHGISIIPINTLNMAQMQGRMSFENVERVDKKVIQGLEAHVILFAEEQKYHSGKEIFLFNPQEGYVLWLYGDYNIPLEELEKVAENLDITVEAEDYLIPEKAAFDLLPEEEPLPGTLREEEITAPGQELDCESAGCGFTVTGSKVYDSIFDVPGYSSSFAVSPEHLKLWLNGDGTHKPYQRVKYDVDGKIVGEEQASPKFLAVTVEARQYGSPVWDGTPLDAALIRMTRGSDGLYKWVSEEYRPLPEPEYELALDGRCFYIDQPGKDSSAKDFFFRNLEQGETVKYTMVFAVDSDLLEDPDTVLLLNFDATGNNIYEPEYSAFMEFMEMELK